MCPAIYARFPDRLQVSRVQRLLYQKSGCGVGLCKSSAADEPQAVQNEAKTGIPNKTLGFNIY